MPIFLVGLPVLAVIYIANLIADRGGHGARLTFNLLLFLANSLLVIAGLALRFLPVESLETSVLAGLIPESASAAASLVLMGLWGMLTCLKPVRQGLARAVPAFDPESPVHTLAFVAIGYLMGNAAFSLAPGALDALAEAGLEVTLLDVLSQQFLFVAAAFLGVGFLSRRDGLSLRQRLGLVRPTARQLLGGMGWMLFFVFLQGCISFTWTLFDSAQVEQLSGINKTMLGSFDTIWEWFLLAAAAGLGEELLFRGALQPIFGIVPTSIIFAVSHVQYGLTPATLAIFLLSVVLGIIRKRHNTTVAIIVHAGYNFTLGLLSLLAVYLQPFIEETATSLLISLRF